MGTTGAEGGGEALGSSRRTLWEMSFDASARAALERTVRWLGLPWAAEQTELLQRYAAWLVNEGVAAGGIGPEEPQRVWRRHLLDSLLLGKNMASDARVLDIGTGVGLPGIPLAIAHPGATVILVDRSGRRIDALHRALAILQLEVVVVHEDVARIETKADRVVSRASLPPGEVAARATTLLADGGEAWVALGWGRDPDRSADWQRIALPPGWSGTVVEVPAEILDSPVWVLRIART